VRPRQLTCVLISFLIDHTILDFNFYSLFDIVKMLVNVVRTKVHLAGSHEAGSDRRETPFVSMTIYLICDGRFIRDPNKSPIWLKERWAEGPSY
jgi:hypothetical protein